MVSSDHFRRTVPVSVSLFCLVQKVVEDLAIQEKGIINNILWVLSKSLKISKYIKVRIGPFLDVLVSPIYTYFE